MIADPAFARPGRFWKGNIHTHSDMSDGMRTPADVCATYRDAGYDFLALTDHFMAKYGFPIVDTRPFARYVFSGAARQEVGPAIEHAHVAGDALHELVLGRQPVAVGHLEAAELLAQHLDGEIELTDGVAALLEHAHELAQALSQRAAAEDESASFHGAARRTARQGSVKSATGARDNSAFRQEISICSRLDRARARSRAARNRHLV
jgi:hypothetical protein